jgi:hypothetical protein
MPEGKRLTSHHFAPNRRTTGAEELAILKIIAFAAG